MGRGLYLVDLSFVCVIGVVTFFHLRISTLSESAAFHEQIPDSLRALTFLVLAGIGLVVNTWFILYTVYAILVASHIWFLFYLKNKEGCSFDAGGIKCVI